MHATLAERSSGESAKLDGQEIPKSDQFHYLGSIINQDADGGDDVGHSTKLDWVKWRAPGVL